MNFKLTILLFIVLSCGSTDHTKSHVDYNPGKVGHKNNVNRKRTFRAFATDSTYFMWSPNHETTKWLCELRFQEKLLTFSFHGQCDFDFFTYLTSDSTTDMLWTYRPDCISDMSFLTNPVGVNKRPETGDLFATFTLINDSVIVAKYYYPEFTDRINKTAKDSLFGKKYYLRNPDGL